MTLPEIVSIGVYDWEKLGGTMKKDFTTPKRKVSMFELELPIEKGGFAYIDSECVPITPNTFICAKPGQTRNTHYPYKCYYIHAIFQTGSLCDLLNNTSNFIEISNPERYKTIYTKMIDKYVSPSQFEEVALQSLLLELIYMLVRDSIALTRKRTSKSNNYQVIEEVIKYIKNNLTEDLTLETLAKVAQISPIHLHNIFKTTSGKLLRVFIEEQRLKKAKTMLLTTNFTLEKIAHDCGFSSQSYFSYVFKRNMKKSPRAYVKEYYDNYEL